MADFTPEAGAIRWDTGRGSIRLSMESIDALLAIYQREEAHALFNALWEARRDLIATRKASIAVVGSMAVLHPISAVVRQLDPDRWPDASVAEDLMC